MNISKQDNSEALTVLGPRDVMLARLQVRDAGRHREGG